MAGADKNRRGSFVTSRHGVALVAFLAIAGYFLWTEHEAHLRALFPYWPWLLLLACPLLHIFMHSGHSRKGRDRHQHGNDGKKL